MQFGAQPGGERLQPGQLVGEFFGADGLAVGKVAAHNAHPVEGAGDDALLLVGKVGNVMAHIEQRLLAQDGHAVVGFLPAEHGLVTGSFDLGQRKSLVLALEFLQAQHIRLVGRKPVEDVGEADLEGVDVPGGDFHAVIGVADVAANDNP